MLTLVISSSYLFIFHSNMLILGKVNMLLCPRHHNAYSPLCTNNYSIKLLFDYNIQNNLTIIIIYRKMKWRWKRTYIEAGEFGGGHEQIIIINRAGGTYKWMKIGNRAGWARFV